MENATKALLIAGSVLIVILLIAVGLRIFNSTQGTVESAQTTMSSTSATMFNSQFIMHSGKNKSKSEVKEVVNKVIANNSSSSHKITLSLYSVGYNGTIAYDNYSMMMSCINNLSETNKYSIQAGFSSDGYCCNIQITP